VSEKSEELRVVRAQWEAEVARCEGLRAEGEVLRQRASDARDLQEALRGERAERGVARQAADEALQRVAEVRAGLG